MDEDRGLDLRHVRRPAARRRRTAPRRPGRRRAARPACWRCRRRSRNRSTPILPVQSGRDFQPERRRHEVFGLLGRSTLANSCAALVVVAGIAADRREPVGRERHEVGEREAPRDVLDVRIEPAVLVHDEDAGQLGRRCVARVGAERTDEIALDAAVALRRRHGDVAGLDPIVGLRHLLRRDVVRHQRLDDRGDRQTGDGKSFHAVQEVAAADFAVNVAVVELDGLVRQLGSFGLHGRAPLGRRIPRWR